jgi:hypothetical protein
MPKNAKKLKNTKLLKSHGIINDYSMMIYFVGWR